MTDTEASPLSAADIEIVIIDDDEDVRINTSDLLSVEYQRISTYASPAALLKRLTVNQPMVILTDLRMPDADGFEFACQALKIDPDLPVILMTGYGDISIAVDAMKQGITDFVEKPFDTDYLLAAVQKAVDKRLHALNLLQAHQSLENGAAIEQVIVGQCQAIHRLRSDVLQFAPMDIPVMIYGDTGVGKELVARSLHRFSRRSSGRFVALNCAAIPEQLAEAELFGHAKGAFTDAGSARTGKLQHANGGTLFLDEIESLPLTTQAKLLRALSDQLITPLGSNQEIAIDCRVISATKDELRNNPAFRQDLFFRLQVAELRIPALKDREGDIQRLFEYYAHQQCDNFGTDYRLADSHTRQVLLQYSWPGNVRELINVATRYAIRGCRHIENAIELDTNNTFDVGAGESLKDMVQAYEEKLIRSKLAEHNGKVAAVLEDLCIERRTFNQKLNRYGINTQDYRD
ncbi:MULTISPECIES: sigma-54 dependent transcriptional regulator [unclassified Oceanobacter]|uniref:sigma-54-dependent transcriptional regulator n=1 Tax=unclassified Oceanobacter TaxID=2620260 RepID=UPI0026E3C3EF|nr:MULTISPECIES: sigma-54 dependent transcriptional regulator [unclassified Oceanobacter]MDO6682196.1 sigma-54 dependent transcriptional regulator [Oceanobacter sp. 5_MG-2023]MDP2504929.1 sigma-54 dependent transcriptional regulator [Oceanobacter sp. 3_MG-2023]MDP2610437.1 sigma-54 dependent transcriptional regulator [Oceanobacter sp. 1_MG-2023]MDP2613673.1 sigma-54 dependent transcriptional regulator [Oceanobacter sp. 2_MG-2023]